GDLFPVRPLPVTGLVPDHAQVHVAVTDVVGHEVRPVDVDRVEFDLPVGAWPQAHGVLDHGEVRAAQHRVVDPGAIPDVLLIAPGRVRRAGVPELVLVRVAVVPVDVVRP